MDYSVKNLLNAAFENGKDVFLKTPLPSSDLLYSEGIPSVIFLPSGFYGGNDFHFCDIRREVDYSVIPECNTITADIRFMASEEFRSFITKRNVKRIFVPFAETVRLGEYCYRESFRWIGEYRAERDDFLQVVAFFPSSYNDFNTAYEVFSTDEAILVNTAEEKDFSSFLCSSPKAKFYFTAAEAEKYAHKRVAVIFNSRGEAADFARFLSARGTDFLLIDGSSVCEDRKIFIERFISGRCRILLSTKTFMPESLFYRCDRCIFAGVPFSEAHLYRLQGIAPMFSVIYCEEDFQRNRKISRSLADRAENEEFFINREKLLDKVRSLFDKV